MMVEQSDERDALRARLAGMWARSQTAGRSTPTTPTRAGRRARADARAGAGGRRRPRARARLRTGRLGLAAAERVGPGGEVVLTDVAEEMTAIAAARGAELGLGNVASAARPRAHRRARRLLRRRAVPRGPHVRAGARPRRRRDPPRAAPGRPRSGRRLGRARAQPVARPRAWTSSARRSGRRCPRPGSPAPSLWATPTSCAHSSTTPAWPTCASRSSPYRCGPLVRRVVAADVGARRPAVGHPRLDARGRPCRPARARPRRPCATTRPRRAGSTSRV
jgi:hypothetical protein